jgi:hypothetical protein
MMVAIADAKLDLYKCKIDRASSKKSQLREEFVFCWGEFFFGFLKDGEEGIIPGSSHESFP